MIKERTFRPMTPRQAIEGIAVAIATCAAGFALLCMRWDWEDGKMERWKDVKIIECLGLVKLSYR